MSHYEKKNQNDYQRALFIKITHKQKITKYAYLYSHHLFYLILFNYNDIIMPKYSFKFCSEIKAWQFPMSVLKTNKNTVALQQQT